MLYPMKLRAPLKDYIWGGTRLKDEFGKKTDLEKVAESWELACHKDGMSVIENGEYAGKTLAEYLDIAGKDVLGTRGKAFPYFPLLIKLIDAKNDLSVQVHPDNDYAMRVEGEYGKTEMWYIVDAEPGASLLYGFKEKVSKKEFEQHIKDNTLLDICNRVPVKKGDVFFIDSGTLHAIGKGILICEIQQNSNTTYRVYDYGRVGKDGKPRELHVAKALDVTKREKPTRKTEPEAKLDVFEGLKGELLAQCQYFTAYHFALEDSADLEVKEGSFQALTVTDGEMELRAAEGTLQLGKGDSAFLPAGMGGYVLKGQGEFILSEV